MEPIDLLNDLKSMKDRGCGDDVQIVLITKYSNAYALRGYNSALEDAKKVSEKAIESLQRQ